MNTLNAVRLMKDISKYGFEYLQNGKFTPDDMSTTQILALAFFSHVQADYDGVISLVCKPKSQAATAHLQLRGLQEAWINMCLMTANDQDDTWSNYLYIKSEQDRKSTITKLVGSGQITTNKATELNREADQLISALSVNTQIPTIANLINPNRGNVDFMDRKPLTLRQRCQVVDHIKENTIEGSMTGNYDVVYKYLSQYTHLDARTAVSAIKDNGSSYAVNLGGSPEDIEKAMRVSFSYYSGCLRILTDLMGDTNERRFKLFETRFDKHLTKQTSQTV